MKLDLQYTKQEAEELLEGGGGSEMCLPDWEVTLRPRNEGKPLHTIYAVWSR